MTTTETKTRRRPALERVLKTADRLFYEGGLHATGVDLIAAEANVSKATMYTYFETKDDLVAAYLRGRSDSWRAHVERELARRGGSPAEKILLVFDLLGEWFASGGFHGCPFINSEAESGPETPAHAENLRHRAWVREMFEGLLREAGVEEASAVALQLSIVYDGCMSSAHSEPELDWARAARNAASRLIS